MKQFTTAGFRKCQTGRRGANNRVLFCETEEEETERLDALVDTQQGRDEAMALGARYSSRQTVAFFQRKRSKARRVIQELTPWSSGLVVTGGQFVTNAGSAYKALNSGTTGASAPTQTQGQHSDGAVTWQFVDPAFFSTLLFDTSLPTPA
jgi:hypothetical protein